MISKAEFKKIFKLIVLFLILVSGFIFIKVNKITNMSPETIKSIVLSFGWKAPIIYIFLYTIRPFFLFPASLLSIAGGLAFGPGYGTLCDIVGGSLGAWLSFCLSRKLGMDATQSFFGRKFKTLDTQLDEHGFRTIVYLRIIPVISFDAISYVAGISKITFLNFALGTAIGIIPGSFIFNLLGTSLNNVFSVQFYTAIVLIILLFAIPLLYRKIRKKSSGI